MHAPDHPRHRHRAGAEGTLRFEADSRSELEDDPLLERARTAALAATRRTGVLVPSAPEAELTTFELDFEWQSEDALRIETYVEGVSRTDLGSRALLAVHVCATNIADGSETETRLDGARITMERGGPEHLEYDFDPPVRAAVLSISDAVASGAKPDRAGRTVREAIESLASHGVTLAEDETLPDDRQQIVEAVRDLRDADVDLICTVGGTGLTHTDTTIEALEPLLDRRVPGLMEAVRDYGHEQTPLAFMSRGIAGLAGDTLVVTLPGSTSGAEEATDVLFPAVLHVFRTLRKSAEHLEGEG